MQKLIGGVAALCALAPGAAQAANSYSTYHNTRFGYAVLYPTNLVSPRPESQNGDGRVFKSSDGRATLTVWGENNVFDRSLKAQMTQARLDWSKDKAKVTYSKMGAGFYVLSGLTGGQVFYEKTVPIRGGFATMLWQYPRTQKTTYDAAVTRTTRAFGTSRHVSHNTSAPSDQTKAPRVALRAPGTNAGGY